MIQISSAPLQYSVNMPQNNAEIVQKSLSIPHYSQNPLHEYQYPFLNIIAEVRTAKERVRTA